MDAADFLRTVWPAEGYYALAMPFIPDGSTKVTYTHRVFDTVASAAQAVDQLKAHKDIYFCVHSLAEKQVWNPKKWNYKTKAEGAFEVRTHGNMRMGRTLFFDLDVGSTANKYPTQAAAINGLKQFIADTRLPKPFVVSSGGGIHVYWPMTHDLDSNTDWRDLATKLKLLAQHHKLLVDPMRTTDTSSVLRVPGTFNRKDPANPRPVRLLVDNAQQTSNDTMVQLLDDELIRVGITITPHLHRPPADDLLGSNTQLQSGPPVGFPALVAACRQIRIITEVKGNVSEPFWYAAIGLVRYCEEGNRAVHYISSGHPDYDRDSTEQKLFQLESKAVGPTTCEKLESVNPGGCDGCNRKGTIKSPLSAARQTEQAPAPLVHVFPAVPDAPLVELPPPPAPFLRLKSGSIGIELGSKKDPDARTTVVILPYDFHPVRRMTDLDRGVETHIWRANLPRVGYVDLTVDADALYDTKKLSTTLANKGIFPSGEESVKLLRLYMVAYINTLQAATDAEMLHTSLGWNDDYTTFVLPDKTLHNDGSVTASNLSHGAERSTAAVSKAGTLERQIELLRFFSSPEYAPNQFSICAALGAPIFHATGHHGVVLNMSGKPGASKSTTLYTGASLWGDPIRYCINGTNSGATSRARDNRMMVTANLPQMVDEITRMNPRDAADMAMGVTQAEGRLRLDMSGVERKSAGHNKSTIMLSTANTSLYSILSAERADSTAESMRVFEIQFTLTRMHKKSEADDYVSELRHNFGHIGEVFMSYVVQHYDEVSERVRTIMRAIDTSADIQAGERFWSAAAAASLTACEIARKLGLLSYNPAVIWHWLTTKQIPSMRGVIDEHYTSSINVLMSYLESVNANMLVLRRGAIRNHDNISNVVRSPEHGQLIARYEQDLGLMWVLKKVFKDYCMRGGHNYTRIMEELNSQKVIVNKNDRKVLGGGTELAKGQAWCFTVDMLHPEVSGNISPIKRPEADVLPIARARAMQALTTTADQDVS
jgi:hypothetical protein